MPREPPAVFYERSGRRIACTTVAEEALDPPADARRGVNLRTLRIDGRTVVT